MLRVVQCLSILLIVFDSAFSFTQSAVFLEAVEAINNVLMLLVLPPPIHSLQFRVNEEFGNAPYVGRDVFVLWIRHPYEFLQCIGESPDSFENLFRDVLPLMPLRAKLSRRNILLLTLWWLRRYPTLAQIALVFDVSQMAASRYIRRMIPILHQFLRREVVWPTAQQWQELRGVWSCIRNAVGAIDGTSHHIYRPSNEDQQHFYSGYRHMHCFHTIVIITNNFKVAMCRGGYLGHNNDTAIFNLMRRYVQIPRNVFLLGDQAFPNGWPIISPYKANQIRAVRGTPLHAQRVAVNKTIRMYRPRVENCIADVKHYEVLHHMYRHDRATQAMICDIIGGLTNRRLQMFDDMFH